jgi:hypothetical protein
LEWGNSRSTALCRDEPLLCLDDDGYYWFLYPFIEKLRAETGQYVDLYGIASFQGVERLALARMLADARYLAEAQPEFLGIHTGTWLHSVEEKISHPVERHRLLELLTHWQVVVDRALELERPVIWLGD